MTHSNTNPRSGNLVPRALVTLVQRNGKTKYSGKIRFEQEGGVNLLAQLWDCAADDLSHYDVTSKPVREISMAAKR